MDPFNWLRQKGRRAPAPPPAPVSAPSPLELPELLHEHVQKGYEREINDNESIWRSLPLFAVLIGFAGASLNFLSAAAPVPGTGAWSWAVYALILVNVGLYGWSVHYLMITVWPRRHRYVANDRAVRKFAMDLLDFHRASGLDDGEADAAAAADLKRYLIEELAEASSEIQTLNRTKAHSRVQALFWLAIGFIFWFLLSSAILVEKKLFEARAAHGSDQSAVAGPVKTATGGSGDPHSAGAAPGTVRGGRGRPSVPPPTMSPAASRNGSLDPQSALSNQQTEQAASVKELKDAERR